MCRLRSESPCFTGLVKCDCVHPSSLFSHPLGRKTSLLPISPCSSVTECPLQFFTLDPVDSMSDIPSLPGSKVSFSWHGQMEYWSEGGAESPQAQSGRAGTREGPGLCFSVPSCPRPTLVPLPCGAGTPCQLEMVTCGPCARDSAGLRVMVPLEFGCEYPKDINYLWNCFTAFLFLRGRQIIFLRVFCFSVK